MTSIHYINLSQYGGAERSFMTERTRSEEQKVVQSKKARLEAAAEIQRLDQEIAKLLSNNEKARELKQKQDKRRALLFNFARANTSNVRKIVSGAEPIKSCEGLQKFKVNIPNLLTSKTMDEIIQKQFKAKQLKEQTIFNKQCEKCDQPEYAQSHPEECKKCLDDPRLTRENREAIERMIEPAKTLEL